MINLDIFEDCEEWANYAKKKSTFKKPNNLDDDERLALALYCWDLMNPQIKHKNFYFILNNLLRERSPQKRNVWIGYFHFFPRTQQTTFRGIPNKDKPMIEEEYTISCDVHWSAYSSTSLSLQKG